MPGRRVANSSPGRTFRQSQSVGRVGAVQWFRGTATSGTSQTVPRPRLTPRLEAPLYVIAASSSSHHLAHAQCICIHLKTSRLQIAGAESRNGEPRPVQDISGAGTPGELTGQSYTPTAWDSPGSKPSIQKATELVTSKLSRHLVEEVSLATFSYSLVTVKLARNGHSHSLDFDSLVLHRRLVVQAQCELSATCWQAA